MKYLDGEVIKMTLQEQLQQLIKDGWTIQDPYGMMVSFKTTKEEFLQPFYKWWKEERNSNAEEHKDMYTFSAIDALWVNKFGGSSYSEIVELRIHNKWDQIGESLGIDPNDVFLMEMQYPDSFRFGYSGGWHLIHQALKEY